MTFEFIFCFKNINNSFELHLNKFINSLYLIYYYRIIIF